MRYNNFNKLENHFRWRSTHLSRIEYISDIIFGFILVFSIINTVQLNNISTFPRILGSLLNCACVGYIWYYHFLFFRRYNINNMRILITNGFFLFILTLIAFPLKNVFILFSESLITNEMNEEIYFALGFLFNQDSMGISIQLIFPLILIILFSFLLYFNIISSIFD